MKIPTTTLGYELSLLENTDLDEIRKVISELPGFKEENPNIFINRENGQLFKVSINFGSFKKPGLFNIVSLEPDVNSVGLSSYDLLKKIVDIFDASFKISIKIPGTEWILDKAKFDENILSEKKELSTFLNKSNLNLSIK